MAEILDLRCSDDIRCRKQPPGRNGRLPLDTHDVQQLWTFESSPSSQVTISWSVQNCQSNGMKDRSRRVQHPTVVSEFRSLYWPRMRVVVGRQSVQSCQPQQSGRLEGIVVVSSFRPCCYTLPRAP
ncbi:hypothetical protein BC567DRAFT_217798 [Phyllosticta citribraziliensis]